MSPPRVAVVVDVVSPYRVPVFRALAELVDLHVVTLAEQDRLREWAAPPLDGFSVSRLPLLPGSQRLSYGRRPIHLSRGVRRRLRAISPDVAVIGGWNQPAFWSAFLPPRDWRAALWVESTARDTRHGLFPIEQAKRFAVRLADSYVVPGGASEIYLRELGATGLIVTAPNAVDSAYIRDIAVQTDAGRQLRQQLGVKHLLAFVGRPEYAKGIDIALSVVSQLGRDVGLVVLGEADERPRWESVASSLGVDRRAHFEGFVDPARVAAVLGGADLMLFPSRSDPWGLVVNEAMAAGCPVVTSPYPGVVEDLLADCAGETVPLVNHRWAEVVGELLADPVRRATMVDGAKRFVTSHSPEACAAGLARLAA